MTKKQIFSILSARTGITCMMHFDVVNKIDPDMGLISEANYFNPDRLETMWLPPKLSAILQKAGEFIAYNPDKLVVHDEDTVLYVLLHELAHATGRRCRLNRPSLAARQHESQVWQEEFIAESVAKRIMDLLGRYNEHIDTQCKEYLQLMSKRACLTKYPTDTDEVQKHIDDAVNFILENWVDKDLFAAKAA